MSVKGAFILPHPPIIIPGVGKGEEVKIKKTEEAYKQIAQQIAKLKPSTIVIISSHATCYRDYFHISPGEKASGSLSEFNAPSVYFEAEYDNEFVVELTNNAIKEAFPAGFFGESEPSLDHGTIIPLYFICREYSDFNLVRIGLSGLSYEDHYRLGMLISDTANKLSRDIVVIGSGDLSHKYSPESPYGFNPSGPVYDDRITDLFKRKAFDELFDFDEELCNSAAECGQRAFCVALGALNGKNVEENLLSHEAPFGVGYAVASFIVTEEDSGRCFYENYLNKQQAVLKEIRESEDEYVSLARQSLEEFVKNDKALLPPENMAPVFYDSKAGVFVSIHLNNKLRGCMGSILPIQKNLASEIISNSISSGIRDPRFLPVTLRELDKLVYEVDILSTPEPIADASSLDVKKYGVIVEKGEKRGLLLPDLEGVDSVAEQIKIAKIKADIDIEDNDVILKRFTVERHK